MKAEITARPLWISAQLLARRLERPLRHGLRLAARDPWPLLACGLLSLAVLLAGLYGFTWSQSRDQQRQIADALDHAFVSPDEAGLAAVRRAAEVAGVHLMLRGGRQGLLLEVSPAALDGGWSARLATRLAAPLEAEQRTLERAEGTWQLTVAAPSWPLWQQFIHNALLMLGWGQIGLLAVALWLRHRRRRLKLAVAQAIVQARSLGEVGYVPPRTGGHGALRPVVHAMDQLHQRLRALFEVHAEQLEALRRQAHMDSLTGLPNRRHFMAVVDAVLGGEGAPPNAGLVLVRVGDLQRMNQRLGNAATDRLLQGIGEVLRQYPHHSGRCAVGRLTGGEFALLLPTGGMAQESARSLLQALRANVARVDPVANLQTSAVELRPPLAAAQALVMAQAALSEQDLANRPSRDPQAPALSLAGLAAVRPATAAVATEWPQRRPAGPSAMAAAVGAAPDDAGADEGQWQRRLARALVQNRVRLGAYPMCTPDGRQLLLDSPLRVQLVSGGAWEPAGRWLQQAARSRLNTVVDERAMVLALAAIARDGEARCVNVADASARSPEFIAAMTRRLSAAPEAASRLWVDLPESLALEAPDQVRAITRAWQPLGTMVALEHCGEHLMQVPRLIDLGLDCVRIDGRFVNGLAQNAAGDARRYLQGLVRLVQSVGLQVTAEAVKSTDDLELLWQLGFDAATGPAVKADQATA